MFVNCFHHLEIDFVFGRRLEKTASCTRKIFLPNQAANSISLLTLQRYKKYPYEPSILSIYFRFISNVKIGGREVYHAPLHHAPFPNRENHKFYIIFYIIYILYKIYSIYYHTSATHQISQMVQWCMVHPSHGDRHAESHGDRHAVMRCITACLSFTFAPRNQSWFKCEGCLK